MCHTLIVANVPRRKRLPRAIVAVTLTRQKGVKGVPGGVVKRSPAAQGLRPRLLQVR